MQNNICCGFGHRDVFENIEARLLQALKELIETHSINTFYVGGNGEFDSIFSHCVRVLKKQFPHIKLYLIKPYFLNSLNTDKAFFENNFNDIIIPYELMGCHYKSAITKRNRWMIDISLFVVTYIRRTFGGGYEAMKYAKAKRKILIEL